MIIFATTQFSIMGLLSYNTVLWVTIIAVVFIVIATITIAIITGQSGSKIKVTNLKDTNNIESKNIVRDDDNLWKYGVYYYNPEDPTLFVEKRFGIGWTLNFGRPMSWIILGGILGLIAVSVIVTFVLVTSK